MRALVDSSKSQLVTLESPVSTPRVEPRLGPGSLLTLPSGSIASDLRPLPGEPKSHVTTYELLVANDTFSPVATYTYVVGKLKPEGLSSWNAITVPPFTSIAVTLDIPKSAGWRDQRVVVELHGDHAHLTLDAVPPAKPPRFGLRQIGTFLTAAIVGGLGILWYSSQWPHITALAAPATVVSGRAFNVAYAASGVRSVDYIVETPDGFQVRRGTAAGGSGSILLDLPPTKKALGYDLRVTAQNGLGRNVRVAHVLAMAAPASRRVPAQIRALSVNHDSVVGGTPVVVHYKVVGEKGTVKLIDQTGLVRASALVNRRGTTVLLAPSVVQDQDFRIVLQVDNSGTSAESSVGVLVLGHFAPGFGGPELPFVTPPTVGPTGAAASSEQDPLFTLSSATVHGGDPIRISVNRHEPKLRIALVTAEGAELTGTDVKSDQDLVLLRAPKHPNATGFQVIATYSRGVGQETYFRPIHIVVPGAQPAVIDVQGGAARRPSSAKTHKAAPAPAVSRPNPEPVPNTP